MYERFYNLRERPFSLSPDPDYLYPSRAHTETLSYLRYGIEGHAGFVVITGEIGSGKTTLLQMALRSLDRQTSVSRLVNTMLDARELIEAVMLDFGLDPGVGRSKPYLLRDLARFLVEQRSAGRLALLVIDEAQNLSPAALEEVRMLSNLETEKSKLIQIVLAGQPNLREVLSRPDLEQLRQRITVSYHLNALDAEETGAYVNHRLRRAALGAPLEFSRDVTDLIHLHSQGIPRKINVIADAVLLFGYGEEQRVITVDLTHEVLQELEANGVIAAPLLGAPAVAAVRPAVAAAAPAIVPPRPAAPPPLAAPPPTAPPLAPPVLAASPLAAPPLAAPPLAPPAPMPAPSDAYPRQVAQRERQLEAQRRVAQQFRQLRDQAAEARAADAVSTAPWPRPADAARYPAPARPPQAAPAATRRVVIAAAPRPPVPVRQPQPTFWARLRRGLSWLGGPAYEKWSVR